MTDRRGRWLLYGAYGYTGQLIADEALRRGLRPVLAGRDPAKTAAMADRLGLEHHVFDLLGARYVADVLRGYDAVLHAAGPFHETYRPMLEGCLQAGTHYLDITGEIAVFEGCFARDAAAREAGIVVMPGVGFDVVPSDCLAAHLKAALPMATSLELAFGGGAGWSRGTARTMVSGLHLGGAVRRGGRIVRVPLAWRSRTVPFRDKPRAAVSIPWGDVSTAYHTTGIPDITVYTAMAPRVIRQMRLARFALPLLRIPALRRAALARVSATVTGPDSARRDAARMQLWGRATDDAGGTAEATLVTPEGYTLTALSSVECVRRVLGGEVPAGATTPGAAFGPALLTALPGCDLQPSAHPSAGAPR